MHTIESIELSSDDLTLRMSFLDKEQNRIDILLEVDQTARMDELLRNEVTKKVVELIGSA